ncbi:hypothetical protein M5K25_020065 [Dendrobium thyrsiflorum]|uniref:Uncharacterized protein n=1 Tax=Dendrobium thyrsiflorum TaxID=117978 RepID=A0ABD0U8Z6_DENTH
MSSEIRQFELLPTWPPHLRVSPSPGSRPAFQLAVLVGIISYCHQISPDPEPMHLVRALLRRFTAVRSAVFSLPPNPNRLFHIF